MELFSVCRFLPLVRLMMSNWFQWGAEVTSSEHQGALAVVTVVVVVVAGAEAGTVGGQAALPAHRAAVASQIQPEGDSRGQHT